MYWIYLWLNSGVLDVLRNAVWARLFHHRWVVSIVFIHFSCAFPWCPGYAPDLCCIRGSRDFILSESTNNKRNVLRSYVTKSFCALCSQIHVYSAFVIIYVRVVFYLARQFLGNTVLQVTTNLESLPVCLPQAKVTTTLNVAITKPTTA